MPPLSIEKELCIHKALLPQKIYIATSLGDVATVSERCCFPLSSPKNTSPVCVESRSHIAANCSFVIGRSSIPGICTSLFCFAIINAHLSAITQKQVNCFLYILNCYFLNGKQQFSHLLIGVSVIFMQNINLPLISHNRHQTNTSLSNKGINICHRKSACTRMVMEIHQFSISTS